MEDLGQRLKQEREAQGVSLNEIAQKTRIGVRLLQAIEAEEFDQLPGGIFNKSFIQQYAQYLGLDEKQAVRDYLRATAAAREAPCTSAPAPTRPSSFDPSPAVLKLTLGVAAIALITLIGWLVLPRSGTPENSGIAAAQSTAALDQAPRAGNPDPATHSESFPATPAVASPAETSQDQVASGPQRAVPGREANTASTPAEWLRDAADHERLDGELPEELLLQINARSTVWISITADGERAWQGTMQANQSREVQAVETIRLTVGNAGGVELTLNGKALGSLGGEGEVKTVTLAARALQEVIP